MVEEHVILKHLGLVEVVVVLWNLRRKRAIEVLGRNLLVVVRGNLLMAVELGIVLVLLPVVSFAVLVH